MTFLTAIGTAAMLNLAEGNWLVISDNVMGGESRGETVSGKSGMVFQGELSLENNGGFSSIRRMIDENPAGATGMRIEIKGDGRQYQARLRLDKKFDGISWSALFQTTGDWQSIDLPLSEFKAVFRGTRVPGAGNADPSSIRQVGFLLADKQAGPFRLEVRKLEFY